MNLRKFFPYESFRPGQEELASSVYGACTNGGYLVAEAVNGFGKTATVLAGSLLAADENDLRIIYACRTKRQIFRVMEELSSIQRNLALCAVDISSKYDYCLLKRTSRPSVSSDLFKWYCNYHTSNNLCSYFLNLTLVPEKVWELSRERSKRFFPHQELLEKSEKIHVCPYEVSRLSIPDARIVVTTYHYLIDEASKTLLNTNAQFNPSRTVIILDEAHNLRDFMRDLSSAHLAFDELDRAVIESETFYLDKISPSLRALAERIKTFCSSSSGWHIDKSAFLAAISSGLDETWLSNLGLELSVAGGITWYSMSEEKALPNSILKVSRFLNCLLSTYTIDGFILTRSMESLDIVNVDPARLFLDMTGDFRSAILLSATIGPSELFLRSIGLQNSTKIFQTNQASSLEIKTIIDSGVTTRFKQRTPEMYSKIVSKLTSIISSHNGGIGIFVSAYAIIEALATLLEETVKSRNLLVERRGLDAYDATKMIDSFKSRRDSVLLAVQGGRFSEGEDFKGEQMDISIVVGLSLPPPSSILFAEYEYLGRIYGSNSYLMISLLPALRKAFQSAGRHIRTPNKKGLVFLLDSRFNHARIIELMPSWLKRNLVEGDFSEEQIEQIVQGFEFS